MLRILLPVDGSENALDAVRHALRLLDEGLRASFVLANVQEPATLYEMVTAPDADVLDEVSEGAGEHLIEAAAALLRGAGVEWQSEIGHGDPAHTLAEIVERYGCDAVIMGARGMGNAKGAFVGSVSHGLLNRLPVPVTIVRHVVPDDTA